MGLIDRIKQKARSSSATKGIEKQSYQIERMKLAREEGVAKARLESKRKMERMKARGNGNILNSIMGSPTPTPKPRTVRRAIRRKPVRRKVVRRVSRPKKRMVRRVSRPPVKKETDMFGSLNDDRFKNI